MIIDMRGVPFQRARGHEKRARADHERVARVTNGNFSLTIIAPATNRPIASHIYASRLAHV